MWARDERFEILGTRFRVLSQDSEAEDGVVGLLPNFHLDRPVAVRCAFTYGFAAAGAVAEQPRLYRDCTKLATGTYDRLYPRLLTDMNRIAVAQYEGLAVHAGVVAKGGRAIAMPADTGGGKSTLTAACIKAGGFAYVSDESLCLNLESGTVEPYPKPVMLSPESHGLLGLPDGHDGEVPFTADALGGEAARQALTLTDVVFPEFGHEGATLTPLPASQIVAGLLRLSFNHYKHPAEAFKLVTSLAQTARAWQLRYGEPLEAAELLERELGAG